MQNFVQLGYESKNFLVNLGGLRSIIIAQGLLIPFFLSLSAFPWCCCPKIQRWADSNVQGIFFNQLIMFIDSTLFMLAITGMLNIREMYYGHLENDTSFKLSVAALAVCFIEMVAISAFLSYF